jgi:hypothetical protein
MKYYINQTTSEIFAYELDGSQDSLIGTDTVPINDSDLAALLAAKAAGMAQIPPTSVTMRQARLALYAANMYSQVQTVVASSPENIQIEWEFSNMVYRSSPVVAAMAAALNLTDDMIDQLFIAAGKL